MDTDDSSEGEQTMAIIDWTYLYFHPWVVRNNRWDRRLCRVHPLVFLVNSKQCKLFNKLFNYLQNTIYSDSDFFPITFNSQTLLMMAVVQFDVPIVKFLIKNYYYTLDEQNENFSDKFGRSVMMLADSNEQTLQKSDKKLEKYRGVNHAWSDIQQMLIECGHSRHYVWHQDRGLLIKNKLFRKYTERSMRIFKKYKNGPKQTIFFLTKICPDFAFREVLHLIPLYVMRHGNADVKKIFTSDYLLKVYTEKLDNFGNVWSM